MAKSIDEQIATLDALRQNPTPEAPAVIRKTLTNKSNVIVAKAAKVAEKLNLKELAEALAEAFLRVLGTNDKGCLAATAIVKTLVSFEATNEEVFLAGAKHVQMEPTWGGSQDVAVELRCESVAALVRMNSRQMWEPLVHLLADSDPQARATAARALGATGHEKAKLLLQYKILVGDAEPSVMGECFGGILAITKSIELVVPFLESRDEQLVEAAALALGESRLPDAFLALRKAHQQNFAADRRILLLAIAMTRQPGAVEYLLSVANEDAIEALAMYRSDSTVREKVRLAAEKSQALSRALKEHFGEP
jgi:HEAT repeat protein